MKCHETEAGASIP